MRQNNLHEIFFEESLDLILSSNLFRVSGIQNFNMNATTRLDLMARLYNTAI